MSHTRRLEELKAIMSRPFTFQQRDEERAMLKRAQMNDLTDYSHNNKQHFKANPVPKSVKEVGVLINVLLLR